MFMTVRKHQQIVDGLKRDVAMAERNYDKQFVAANHARDQRDQFKRQLDHANAELATLRASRARSNANLANANAAKKAKAGRGK